MSRAPETAAALVLRFAEAEVIALADEVRRVDDGPATAGRDLDPGAAILLDRALGLAVAPGAEASPKRFVVVADGAEVHLVTRATVRVEELRREAFFRLPALMRRADNLWVRGLVLRVVTTVPTVRPDLALWIDLRALALRAGGAGG